MLRLLDLLTTQIQGDSISAVRITSYTDDDIGTLTYTSAYGGEITISDTTSYQLTASEAATLKFAATGQVSTTADVDIKFTVADDDGDFSANAGTLTIQVTDGNDAPTFTDTSDTLDVSVDEKLNLRRFGCEPGNGRRDTLYAKL